MHFDRLKRRELIALLTGAAAAWPVAARDQSNPKWRIGVLLDGTATDANAQSDLAAFVQGLRQIGWTEEQKVHMDLRWNVGDLAGSWTVDETFDVVSTDPDDPEGAVRVRRGWILSDGTGAGKGRQVAGILLDNWLKGRRRAVSISKFDKRIAHGFPVQL